MSTLTPFERRLAELTKRITDAATAFEKRWTLAALRRVNPDIAGRLGKQIDLWHAAVKLNDVGAIEKQGEAMVRGYRKAAEVLTDAQEPDDAYLVGQGSTGLRLVIGHSPAQADAEPGAIFFTPDELAELLPTFGGEAFQALLKIKRAFPGALALADADRH
jgi:hypothetical protein